MGRLSKALSKNLSYDQAAKREFELAARQALRKLAKVMDPEPGTYEIRYNAGGVAVSGEATLHHDNFYVQVSQGSMGPGCSVLYRTCRGRKDYVGGQNHWASAEQLEDAEAFWHTIRALTIAEAMR